MNTLPHEPLGPLVLMLQLVQALQRVHTLQRIHNFPVELMAGQGTVAGMPKASGYNITTKDSNSNTHINGDGDYHNDAHKFYDNDINNRNAKATDIMARP